MCCPTLGGNDLHLKAEIPHACNLSGISAIIGYHLVNRGKFADFAECGRAKLGSIRKKNDPARIVLKPQVKLAAASSEVSVNARPLMA